MGYDDPIGGRRVGASEKRATIRNMLSRERQIVSKTEGPPQSRISSFIFVLGVSTLLAWFVTTEKLMKGPGYHPTGFSSLDKFLMGNGVPALTGNHDYDLWLLIGMRGLAVTLLAGIQPFLTWVYVTVTDRTRGSFYITSWGASSIVILFGYLGWNYLAPFLNDIFELVFT